jgi:hypothetical protein
MLAQELANISWVDVPIEMLEQPNICGNMSLISTLDNSVMSDHSNTPKTMLTSDNSNNPMTMSISDNSNTPMTTSASHNVNNPMTRSTSDNTNTTTTMSTSNIFKTPTVIDNLETDVKGNITTFSITPAILNISSSRHRKITIYVMSDIIYENVSSTPIEAPYAEQVGLVAILFVCIELGLIVASDLQYHCKKFRH